MVVYIISGAFVLSRCLSVCALYFIQGDRFFPIPAGQMVLYILSKVFAFSPGACLLVLCILSRAFAFFRCMHRCVEGFFPLAERLALGPYQHRPQLLCTQRLKTCELRGHGLLG